jgi:hypothetical protein
MRVREEPAAEDAESAIVGLYPLMQVSNHVVNAKSIGAASKLAGVRDRFGQLIQSRIVHFAFVKDIAGAREDSRYGIVAFVVTASVKVTVAVRPGRGGGAATGRDPFVFGAKTPVRVLAR